MGEKIQKILSGRRVTIPSDAAARLGMKEGDLAEIDYGKWLNNHKACQEDA